MFLSVRAASAEPGLASPNHFMKRGCEMNDMPADRIGRLRSMDHDWLVTRLSHQIDCSTEVARLLVSDEFGRKPTHGILGGALGPDFTLKTAPSKPPEERARKRRRYSKDNGPLWIIFWMFLAPPIIAHLIMSGVG